jgi:membrane associated rhomboid family serine protease
VTTARRRTSDLGSAFTLGGRIPSGLGMLLAAILVATVGSWVTRNSAWAVLVPGLLLEGQLWRLVSWAFVQSDPLTLLFGGFMLYSIGAQLAFAWSERRVLGTFLGLAVFASVVTLVVAITFPAARQPHLGMWPVVNALVVMWALRNPEQQVNIWGVLPVTGRVLALLMVFGTVLYGLAGGGVAGLFAFTPHFAALALAYALTRGRFPTKRWTLQASDWMAEREFKRKSRHLKVVDKNKDEPPKWVN